MTGLGNIPRGIMVAATKQHVGKTTSCLALMSGLRKKFDNRVGFLKPVGQPPCPKALDNMRVTQIHSFFSQTRHYLT